ncbi:hypothetical protein [Microcoleus sp. B4-C1]|uniref:hypothetical protein n=1 Tax=Microcoleus sp. B4-C1 TaxID=2818660 RepID=UPI002FD17174
MLLPELLTELLPELLTAPATESETETETETAETAPETETENKSCFTWIIKNNYPDADFWLINKGSQDKLGKPIKKFEPFLTGIKCPVLVIPEYGYYMCLHLHQQGLWKKYAIGSITWKNLRLKDIKAVFQHIGHTHRNQHQSRYKSFIPAQIPAERQEFFASL